MKEELLFCPLGGAGEIGMNMNLFAYGRPDNQKWIIVDIGVTFADDTVPGVDLIYPDPGFIIDKNGIVVTNNHVISGADDILVKVGDKEYKAKVLRVVDGDTVDVDIDLGFGIWMHRERVRMMGIDTPESRTRDKVEKAFGLASKARLKELLPIGSITVLKTEIDKSGEDKKGKFGRILGDFIVDGKRATDILIEEGHAVAYFGGSKEEVQMKHMANREKLLREEKVILPK